MKKIELSYNQSKKIAWLHEIVRLKKDGLILYIEMIGDDIIVKTWSGQILQGYQVIIDEAFI